MTILRVKDNLGFLIAGAVLFSVAVNVYYELGINGGTVPTCQFTSTPLPLSGQ